MLRKRTAIVHNVAYDTYHAIHIECNSRDNALSLARARCVNEWNAGRPHVKHIQIRNTEILMLFPGHQELEWCRDQSDVM